MKRNLSILFFLPIFTQFLFAPPAFAQEGETPQITLSVYEASPGATIEITGGHFEPDVLISFYLIQNGNQVPVGTAVADWEGHFTVSLLLPHDLQLGQYEFQALDERNRSAFALIAIIPDPNAAGSDPSRDEDDNLLAPMPTFAPGVVPGEPAQSTNPQSAPSTQITATSSFLWIGLGLLVVLSLTIFGLKKIRRA